MAEASYNEAVESFRDQEYPMLKDNVYLDHAGSALCAKSLMTTFAVEMSSTLYGNPHSSSSPSQLSTTRIEDVRLQLLDFFKGDPAEYDLVFVSNATAGVKLVLEGVRCLSNGFFLAYHEACHTSVVGMREEAIQSSCLDDSEVESWLRGKHPFTGPCTAASTTLFAYSAQSHMTGVRYPLSWAKDLKARQLDSSGAPHIFTLLDASSLVATSQVDLSDPQFAADFIVLSLYKIFGFPDLGVLIVRRAAENVFDNRKYFGGGTVDMVVCREEQWHVRKSRLHERLEDGTLPFHNIMAVDIAIQTHLRLFGSMNRIHSHTSYLHQRLYQGLTNLKHGNRSPVCYMYSNPLSTEGLLNTGPVISFNLRDAKGAWISIVEFEKLAILSKMHTRTGGLCSPAKIASTLNLQPGEMRESLSAGFRCGEDSGAFSDKPTGVIRVSLGAMSTKSDVDCFIAFIEEFFVESRLRDASTHTLSVNETGSMSNLQVRTITVYPIKSCGGFIVPKGTPWDIRPEGLAWDREWCLVHRGSGQALSQKRYPKMALLQPSLILDQDVLRVKFRDGLNGIQPEIDIPLSLNDSLFDTDSRQTSPRVCGERVSAQSYRSAEINDFFSGILKVSCMLVRFPPGGWGIGSRSSKARMQKHQWSGAVTSPYPGSFPDIPSPPDSDSEGQRQAGKILLSNESPILMIHMSSLTALNKDIQANGGSAVADATFRANIVIEAIPGQEELPPYSEDSWTTLRIGDQNFNLLGSCQRCQMVCVDQATGDKRQEPFITLAKTRRINGKIYFGAHMRHQSQYLEDKPKIQIGDLVVADARAVPY